MDDKKTIADYLAEFNPPDAAFPYLFVRIRAGLHGIVTLPADYSRDQLIELARFEHRARDGKFPMCVVFGQMDAVHIQSDGSASPGPRPVAGQIFPWRLAASRMVG